MQKLLIIDNNDSFTYNLVEVIRQNNQCLIDVCMLESIKLNQLPLFNGVILSPGPGLPAERKQFNVIIAEIIKLGIPLLGVCLGHQAIAEFFAGKIIQLNRIIHGESSEIEILSDELFIGLGERIRVGRYHSWIVDRACFPNELIITAQTTDALIMAFKHQKLNVRGVQFHPESVLTPSGQSILSNWLAFCVK